MISTKFWDQLEDFSASEAAQLILGMEPEEAKKITKASYQFLIKEMHKAYLDLCAHFRFCLERDIDPHETPTWAWMYDEDEEIEGLASVEMRAHYRQVDSAKTRDDFVQSRHYALLWLESAIDQFDRQRFPRVHVANWLDAVGMKSEYDFDRSEEITPEKRREDVRRLMLECGNNKSEVARRMGISRTRVDQLLVTERVEKRNPFQLKAQDPFGITRRPK